MCECVCVCWRARDTDSYLGSPLRGAAGPWQRRSAPGRWRRRGAVWGRTSCYRRSLLHPAQASGSVSPDAAAWRDRGPIQVTAAARRGEKKEKVRNYFRKKHLKRMKKENPTCEWGQQHKTGNYTSFVNKFTYFHFCSPLEKWLRTVSNLVFTHELRTNYAQIHTSVSWQSVLWANYLVSEGGNKNLNYWKDEVVILKKQRLGLNPFRNIGFLERGDNGGQTAADWNPSGGNTSREVTLQSGSWRIQITLKTKTWNRNKSQLLLSVTVYLLDIYSSIYFR